MRHISRTGADEIAFVAVGDLHTGSIAPERLAAVFGTARDVSDAAFVAIPGDLTNEGRPEQYSLLMRHAARLPIPFHGIMGNHETHFGTEAEARERFQRAMGVESPTYRREYGGWTFLFLSTDASEDGCTVHITRSMGLLEDALESGEGPLTIFCHAPLRDTVLGVPDRPCFLSSDPAFGLKDSDAVRALIRRHKRPVLWVCGHTHTPVEAATLIVSERLDGTALHTVNVSCPYYTCRDQDFQCPILLFHFTVGPVEARVWVEDAGLRQSVREAALRW